jgi:hypothetical protein
MTVLLAAELPYPFLLADLLLTRPGAGLHTEIPLPSVGLTKVKKLLQRNLEVADRLSYSSLTSKLCFINNSLLIGWSGSMFFANSLIQRLKAQIGDNSIDRHSLLRLLSKHNDLIENAFGPLGLICLGVSSSDPYGYVVWRNCEYLHSKFGVTVVGGSGSSMVRELLPSFENLTIDVSDQLNPREEYIKLSTGLLWTGLLTCIERVSGSTLSNFFGADLKWLE